MNILFISDNFYPEYNAPANRTLAHCRFWVEFSEINVTVITSFPNFPDGKIFKGYKNRLFQIEHLDGIRVIRVWTFVHKNQGVILRTIDHLSFMVTSVIGSMLLVRNVTCVLATSPQFFTLLSGYLVSRLKFVPFIAEIRDMWPDSLKAVGISIPRLFLYSIERIEKFLYRNAHLIVAVSPSFKDEILAKEPNSARICTHMNGVESSRIVNSDKTAWRFRATQNNPLTIIYCGTLGLAHQVEILIDAVAILKARNIPIRVDLLGKGAERFLLEELVIERDLSDCVNFLTEVANDRVIPIMSTYDLSFVHLRRSKVFDSVIPSKIFESFAAGTPILFGLSGLSKRILEASECAISFEQGSSSDLAGQLELIALDRKRLIELSENALKCARRYNRERIAAGMLSDLKAVMKRELQ